VTSAYDPDPPAATPLKVLFLAGVLVLGVVTVGPELGTFLPRTPEQEAVAVAVERALVASQSAAVPQVRDAAGRVPVDELARLHAALRTTADEYFSGDYHDSWIAAMDGAIDREGAQNTVFGGGADTFSRWHIDIEGSQATVQVRARMFLELAQTPLGYRSVAQNIVDFDIWLSYVDGSWLVGAIDQEFAPGGGP
jgi:hypothetical protein